MGKHYICKTILHWLLLLAFWFFFTNILFWNCFQNAQGSYVYPKISPSYHLLLMKPFPGPEFTLKLWTNWLGMEDSFQALTLYPYRQEIGDKWVIPYNMFRRLAKVTSKLICSWGTLCDDYFPTKLPDS